MNKIKYRIKIKTFGNGRKEYFAQVKYFIGWRYLMCDGEPTPDETNAQDTRDSALKRIDKHYSGNAKIVNIEFVYVTK